MKIGIPKEVHPGERRVAATPDNAKRLQKYGFEVLIEAGAGALANFGDDAYAAVGCTIVPEVRSLYNQADIVLKVREPEEHPTDETSTDPQSRDDPSTPGTVRPRCRFPNLHSLADPVF